MLTNCPDCNGKLSYRDFTFTDSGTGERCHDEWWTCDNCGSVWTETDLRCASHEAALASDAGDHALDCDREDPDGRTDS